MVSVVGREVLQGRKAEAVKGRVIGSGDSPSQFLLWLPEPAVPQRARQPPHSFVPDAHLSLSRSHLQQHLPSVEAQQLTAR